MEHMEESDAYISMKYYKETFPPKPACRLFNPSNSEIGKATKARVNLININQKILEKYYIGKARCSFILFDIVSFLPLFH